jgi:hypothetical protein
VATLYVEAGSPWEDGYAEAFNRRLRDELLNAEEFANVREARCWRTLGRRTEIGSGRTAR